MLGAVLLLGAALVPHARGQLLASPMSAPGGGLLGAGCSADSSADGVVSVTDILQLLGSFGQAGGAAAATDINGDGAVGVDDLLLVLSAFGQQCHALAPGAAAADGGGTGGAAQAVVGTGPGCGTLTVAGHEQRTHCVHVPTTTLPAGSRGLPVIMLLCVNLALASVYFPRTDLLVVGTTHTLSVLLLAADSVSAPTCRSSGTVTRRTLTRRTSTCTSPSSPKTAASFS